MDSTFNNYAVFKMQQASNFHCPTTTTAGYGKRVTISRLRSSSCSLEDDPHFSLIHKPNWINIFSSNFSDIHTISDQRMSWGGDHSTSNDGFFYNYRHADYNRSHDDDIFCDR